MAKSSIPKQIIKLFRAAHQAQENAHAPYSHRYIGAAVLMSDGNIYAGCNIENASYGGTVCAERVAIFKAISEGGKMPLKEVLVLSNEKEPWPPCGFCRQVIAEFAKPNTLIHTTNPHGKFKTYKFSELFPEAFSPNHLKKRK